MNDISGIGSLYLIFDCEKHKPNYLLLFKLKANNDQNLKIHFNI